jgi:hypothetical protein
MLPLASRMAIPSTAPSAWLMYQRIGSREQNPTVGMKGITVNVGAGGRGMAKVAGEPALE